MKTPGGYAAACATACAIACAMVLAAGAATAGPPATGHLSHKSASALLTRLAAANVAGIHCADFLIGSAEWKLVTDTAGALARQIGLDNESYSARYYDAAFAAEQADPDFCAREGPLVRPLIAELLEMGGTIDKFKPEAF